MSSDIEKPYNLSETRPRGEPGARPTLTILTDKTQNLFSQLLLSAGLVKLAQIESLKFGKTD